MNKTLTLKVLVHHVDCGDGSTSAHFYNDVAEFKADLAAGGWDPDTRFDEIESGEDPYENGSLSECNIEVQYDVDTGTAKIKHFSINSDG